MEIVDVSDAFRIYVGDVRDALQAMQPQSVHMVVTSPPYWALRDYGIEGQLGLEGTPDEYVQNMVAVFRDVWRVLRDDGTLWLNLGDTYAANRSYQVRDNKHTEVGNNMPSRVPDGIKAKDMVGIPWMLAFALRSDGWYLRSDIIWHKVNPMPSSVKDRPTTSHEYLFLLTKKPRYFYDKHAIAEPAEWDRWGAQTTPKHMGTKTKVGWIKPRSKREIMELIGPRNPRPKGVEAMSGGGNQAAGTIPSDGRTRNKRTVWSIPTQSYKGSHYATFPEKLAEICILAGTSEAGCCFECGAPWVRVSERVPTGFDGSRYGEASVQATGGASSGGTKQSTLGSGNGKMTASHRTLGWEPSCSHYDADFFRHPCIVLDPFIGSGTTAQVARSLGRHCVGIDLDHRNVPQAIERYNTPTRVEKKIKKVRRARKPKEGQLAMRVDNAT